MEAALRLIRGIAAVVAVALLTGPSWGQERDFYQAWIHANAKECCPHDRCFPVIVAPGSPYWNVLGFKSQVPMGRERRWPFERTYGCAYAAMPDVIRCLFMPPPEAS